MNLLAVNDYVRLVCDMPELDLSRGEIGVVRSKWCAPDVAYEVEFQVAGLNEPTRALLMAHQIERDDSLQFDESSVMPMHADR